MPKILLIHTPKFHDRFEASGDMMFVNVVANGLFSVGGYLRLYGYDVRILHLGVEWIKAVSGGLSDSSCGGAGVDTSGAGLDPCGFAQKFEPDLAGFSLQWHHQSYDVVESARKLKERFPDVPVVLGGLTAAYFAREIMENFDFIDFIIAGDGEVPMRMLADQLTGGAEPDFELIPGLYYRKDGVIIEPSCRYEMTQDVFEKLDYCCFDLMEDFEFYRDSIGIPAIWLKNMSIRDNRERIEKMRKIFFPVAGKGCPHNCTWCGRERRRKMLSKSVTVVVDSIKRAIGQGMEFLYMTYDACPRTGDYYIELFREMKREGIDVPVYFESWGLPDEAFFRAFKESFSDGVIGLSPESACEKIRTMNGRPSISNEDLYKTLKITDELNIETDLFFCAGLPGENRQFFAETENMISYIQDNFKCVSLVRAFALLMEPGAPWFENPGKFGIVSNIKDFMDFYRMHSPEGKGSYNAMGYYIPGYFGEGVAEDVDSFETEILKMTAGGKNPLAFCVVNRENETA
ncbi:MAG: cobalamin-dependent protein [Firmicutes bacterium]|nr:cobalamin-dependent protein [Bacillota bacterium]